MSESAEAAPTGPSEVITLKVVDQAKEEMFFKVKKGTKISKVYRTSFHSRLIYYLLLL
jgi:hypothetical protein